MSKKTINKLLYATMGILIAGICFLLFKIATRPHYISTSDTVEVATIPEIETSQVSLSSTEDNAAVQSEETDITSNEGSVLSGKASSMVNIREMPSTDSRVLETVEKDYPFEILEILSDGWTKIKYNDSIAYVSSQFVILTN